MFLSLLEFFKEKFVGLKIVVYLFIGIVLFGFLDLCKEFKIFGYIIIIFKEGWRNVVDVVGFFKCEFGEFILIVFEIDCNVFVMVEMV